MRYSFAVVRALSVILMVMLAQGCDRSSDSQQNANRGDNQQGAARDFATSTDAANEGLKTFALLVTEENHKAMGFDAVVEVKDASLGQSLQLMMVGLEQLRKFDADSDPNALLNDTRQVIFPVQVRGETRSSISVVQSESGGWKAVGYGNPHLAKQIDQGRKAIIAMPQASPNPQASPSDMRATAAPTTAAQNSNTATTPTAPSPSTTASPLTTASPQATPASTVAVPDIVVHVAALNLHFIGHRSGGRLMLTALDNNPNYGLRAGATAPAEEVFARLAANEIVKKHNGLPM